MEGTTQLAQGGGESLGFWGRADLALPGNLWDPVFFLTLSFLKMGLLYLGHRVVVCVAKGTWATHGHGSVGVESCYPFHGGIHGLPCNTLYSLGFFLRFYLFLVGEGGRKRGRETSTCGSLSQAPYWGTWPTIHAFALTGNRTGVQADTQSTEPHEGQGLSEFFRNMSKTRGVSILH